MQVNTKEILLHPPPKGLANCVMEYRDLFGQSSATVPVNNK